MSAQPDVNALSVEGLRELLTMRTEALARVIERAELAEGVIRERANVYRAGLVAIDLSRKDDAPIRPSDLIHLAENPDLGHPYCDGGDEHLTNWDEPLQDSMIWTAEPVTPDARP
jgi:hypothetical protein